MVNNFNDKNQVIKTLFVGDNHMTDSIVPMRTDNYGESCLRELKECLTIATECHCDLIVFLGDVFNKLRVGQEYLNSVLRMFAGDYQGNPWPFRKIVIIGNHDIYHNMQFYPESALCALESAGVIEVTDSLPEYGIAFESFSANLDSRIANGLFATDSRRPIIWAAHASVTNKQIFGNYILFEDLRVNPECKLVVTGHIHEPMESKREDGVIFINPGNVGRYSATKENMGRDVRVLLTEHSLDGNHLNYSYKTLLSALPSSKVFKVREIQERKDTKRETGQFLEQAMQLSTWSGSSQDRVSEIRTAAKIKGIAEKVANCAADAVEEIIESRDRK